MWQQGWASLLHAGLGHALVGAIVSAVECYPSIHFQFLAYTKVLNTLPLPLMLRAMQMLGGGHTLTGFPPCCLLPVVAHAVPNVPHSHRCCQGACRELSPWSGVQDQAQVGGLVELSGARAWLSVQCTGSLTYACMLHVPHGCLSFSSCSTVS